MAFITSFLFLAAIMALSCAVPYFPRPMPSLPQTTTGNTAKARSSGFSITWSPGEQALLQRVTDSLTSNENNFLSALYDNLNDDEKAILQTISISWSKAFIQGLLEELSDEEKASLQRFTLNIGGEQERAEKQQQMPEFNNVYQSIRGLRLPLPLPASEEATAERDVRYPTYIGKPSEANAENLSPTDILGLVSDLSNNVANRINNNRDNGKPSLGATDFLGLVSDLADKVSTRLDNNGGSKAEKQDFTLGDAARLIGAVALGK